MANMIQLEINGKSVEVPAGTNLLNAARAAGIEVPNLCYHPDLKPGAACGLCICRQLVQDRADPSKWVASPKMLRACCTEAMPGMKIITRDPDLQAVRKSVLELILANHPQDCLQCKRSGSCELQRLSENLGVTNVRFPREVSDIAPDGSSCAVMIDSRKCIKCGRCIEVCQNMQNVWALEFIGRGEKTVVKPAAGVSLSGSPCVKCGQCIAHCPVAAIVERDSVAMVTKALESEDKYCVIQAAPSVRVALGEAFGGKPGEIVTGQMYAAMRALGFKKVFDANFAADATIMEEGYEFIKRLTSGDAAMPQFTSCCPGWVDWCEKYAPDFLPNLSSAKSPMQMESALIKTYFAQKEGIDPKNIYVVAVMPCTAKKWEIRRDDHMSSSGAQDTDAVLTTREFARLCKINGIDPTKMAEEPVDSLLGSYTGAGTIFGFTGGVMEAALRTAYCVVSGEKNPPALEFSDIRGMQGVKEATVTIPAGDKKIDVRVAVIHQLSNVQPVLDQLRKDREAGLKPRYDFIEVMACRGGCVGGGGQPHGTTDEVRAARTQGLMTDDEKATLRLSHENPDIKKLYEDFLKEPLSETAHHLLHTTYQQRPTYAE